MWHWLQANAGVIIAFFALIVSLATFGFYTWRYNKIHQEELKQQRFKNYHELIYKLVAGGQDGALPRLDCQIAIVYELRKYPEYREVSIRILEGLCQVWTNFKEADKETKYDRLLKEIPLTLSQLQQDNRTSNWKKGTERVTWVLSLSFVALFFGLGFHSWLYKGYNFHLGKVFLLSGLSFAGVWVVYYTVLYVIKGFRDDKSVDQQKQ